MVLLAKIVVWGLDEDREDRVDMRVWFDIHFIVGWLRLRFRVAQPATLRGVTPRLHYYLFAGTSKRHIRYTT